MDVSIANFEGEFDTALADAESDLAKRLLDRYVSLFLLVNNAVV